MKKLYYLKSCDTCKRIMNEVGVDEFELQEIKSTPVTAKQLEAMYSLTHSYSALFNKRARLYKVYDLKNKELTEEDYKKYLLEEYTFLKRPVFLIEDKIFVGNSKKTIEQVKETLLN